MVNYFSFGFRNLRRRGIRSWLTLLGIFIGITAVVALISLGNGLKTAVNSQFGISTTNIISVEAGGVNGYGPPGSGAVRPLTKQDAQAIERVSGVEVAIPRNIVSGKLEYNDIVAFGYAGSLIEGKEEEIYELIDLKAEAGNLLKKGDTRQVLLGNNLGYKESNPFGKDITPGKTVLIDDQKFEVAGILEKKGSFIFDNVIWVWDKELEDLKGYGDDVSIIAVEVKDKNLMDKVAQDIEKLLRDRRDVKVSEEDFEVSTPQAALDQVNSVLSAIQIFIIIISSISIIVGAIGIVNTMTTSILERRREIGILKAIGARNENIFFQFLVESGLLGLIGGLFGVISGLAIGFLGVSALNSFLGSDTDIEINFYLILFSLIGSFLIGAVSGIVPALKAAHQNPVDAIRS